MKKFNNKLYQGKARLYSELKQYPRISKLWVWNEIKMSYEPPERGKAYLARKYSEDRKRLTAYFETLEEAKLDIFNYIYTFYNQKRRHSTLQYKTPNQWEQNFKQMKNISV